MKKLEQLKSGKAFTEKYGSYYCQDYYSGELSYEKNSHEKIKEELLNLSWLTKRTARHEYFMSLAPRSYSYAGSEEYISQEFSPLVLHLMDYLNQDIGANFNVCFLNKYDDQHQHLGWHADDFPGMDPEEPIAVVSFGAEREIWVKDQRGFECDQHAVYGGNPECFFCAGTGFVKSSPIGKQPDGQKILLHDGSLFIMPPGYQDTHFHRIPKHSRPCGWRISLTFRTFKP